MLTTLISARVHPGLHHLIMPSTRLLALGIDPVDALGLCDDIERKHGMEFTSDEGEAWQTCACVEASFLGQGGVV